LDDTRTCPLYCEGGVNHLGVEGFIAVFREQEWRHPEQAVLVLTTDDLPTIVVRQPDAG
jgi:hypothetical protein